MKAKWVVLIAGLTVLGFSFFAGSHCQIPCGIYGDDLRFDLMAEHIQTIEKSINEIKKLAVDESKNINQSVRWVNNKDLHCDEFSEIITYYFMAQRVKPAGVDDKEYVKKICLLHSMLVNSMKAKQNVDTLYTDQLKVDLKKFKELYHKEE